MAEFVGLKLPEEDEDLDNKPKKKRLPSFLDTYLRLRSSETNKESNEDDTEDKTDKLWRKIADFFIKKSETAVSQSEFVNDRPNTISGLPETYEALEDEPEYFHGIKEIDTPEKSELVVNHGAVEGGELTIDHSEPEEVNIEPEIVPLEEINTDTSVSTSPEQVGNIVERMSRGPSPINGAVRAQEIWRERQERLLKRDVKRVKQHGRQQTNRQRILERRQKELESQLQTQMRREEQLQNSLFIEKVPNFPPPIEAIAKPNIERQLPPQSTEAPAKLNLQQFRELVGPRPETTQSEDILYRVEAAAESNLPIEQFYERSHEIKDESTTQSSSKRSAFNTSIRRVQELTGRTLSRVQSSTAQLQKLLPKTAQPQQNNSNLYSQAIKSGFWAAVVILVLVVIATLVQ